MFGIFKGRKAQKNTYTEEQIAEELFSQILSARDEAKSGGLIDEKVFNDRLNHMYTAGYLVGYVDYFVSGMTEVDAEKKEKSKNIFEKMFPGTGFDFVRAKVTARQQAAAIEPDDPNYPRVAQVAVSFDTGLENAQDEVEGYLEKRVDKPAGLKCFLLLGEVKRK